MTDQPERPITAVSVPMSSGAGMSPAVGVAAPIGAVSRKDRGRASRTSARREGATVVVHTELPGTVVLQRRDVGGAWDALDKHPAARVGDTRIDLPQDAASSTFRVVFTPRNTDINAWVSESFDH